MAVTARGHPPPERGGLGWGLMAAQPVEVIAILHRYQPPSRPSPFLGEGEKHAQPDSSGLDPAILFVRNAGDRRSGSSG